MIATLFALFVLGSFSGWARVEFACQPRGRAPLDLSLDVVGSALRLINDRVSFVDVVSSCSSMDMFHCPLAGFVLIGSQGGDLLLLSREGTVALEATGPVGAGPLRVVRTVQTRGHHNAYDVLLVASFDGVPGLHGLLINHRTMDVDPRGWLVLSSEVNDVVDVRVVTYSMNGDKSRLLLPSVVVLDANGDAYVSLDVGLNVTVDTENPAVGGGDSSFNWEFHLVEHRISHIFASYKFGVFLVGRDNAQVYRVDRQSLKAVVSALSVPSSYKGSASDLIAFDDVFHEVYISRIDDMTLRRHKVAPEPMAEVHSIPLLDLLDRPTHIDASGGYSLISGSGFVVLYNHSADLVKDPTAPWDTGRFVSLVASEEDLMNLKKDQSTQGIFYRFCRWLNGWKAAKPGFEGRLAVWGPLTFLYRNTMVVVSSSRRSIQLYRPTFRAVIGKKITPSPKGTSTLLLGIFKSIGLLGAGVVGLVLSKRNSRSNFNKSSFRANCQDLHPDIAFDAVLDEAFDEAFDEAVDAQLANIYTEYRIERDDKRAYCRKKVPVATNLKRGGLISPKERQDNGGLSPQDRVDFAPDPELWLG